MSAGMKRIYPHLQRDRKMDWRAVLFQGLPHNQHQLLFHLMSCSQMTNKWSTKNGWRKLYWRFVENVYIFLFARAMPCHVLLNSFLFIQYFPEVKDASISQWTKALLDQCVMDVGTLKIMKKGSLERWGIPGAIARILYNQSHGVQ